MSILPTLREAFKFTYLRELTEADIAFGLPQAGAISIPPLQRIRDSHHRVAQLLAQGMRPVEVSQVTGYCASRISILQNDPSFRALCEHYRQENRAANQNVVERLKLIGLDALTTLHDRILSTPEEVKVDDLRKIVETVLDRAGYNPTQKVETRGVQVSLTAEDIAKLRETIPVEAVEVIRHENNPRT